MEAVIMTRDRAELDFIRDRVLQDIKERPSIRPYLGESEIARVRATCQRGHRITGSGKQRRCMECRNAWRRERRKRGTP